MICPGLGHVNRGFETFTRECFDVLNADARLNVKLYKGQGSSAPNEKAIGCLKRHKLPARILAATIGRDGYYVEATTFALTLIPRLLQQSPDVVYFSDGVVGNYLWRWRKISRSRYKLLLSNGGPLGPPLFPRFDHVHQVSPLYFDESARAGRLPDSQTLIPYGFYTQKSFLPPTDDEKGVLRKRLGLPLDQKIVVCVGALNRGHKRTDYVIREIASMTNARPFLVLLGQFEAETPSVLEEATQRLGAKGYVAKSVGSTEVTDYYRSADVFTLGSIKEGFGRVFVEASAQGLRSVAHDGPVQRDVLGTHGSFGDFNKTGALASLLAATLEKPDFPSCRVERNREVVERFGWCNLVDRYVEMILQCAIGSKVAKC